MGEREGRKGGHGTRWLDEENKRRREREPGEENGEPDFQPDSAILNISDVRCLSFPFLSKAAFLVLSFRCFVPRRSRSKALKGNFITQTFARTGKCPRNEKRSCAGMAGKRKHFDDDNDVWSERKGGARAQEEADPWPRRPFPGVVR